jgi:tellurium resistance protein TerD
MTIELIKGGNVNLTKECPILDKVLVKITWEINNTDKKFDLDAGAFLLDENGKVRTDSDFIFYNCLKEQSQACVIHQWNDIKEVVVQESFVVSFYKIPLEIKKIPFSLTIYNGAKRKQNFSFLKNASITLIDSTSQEEIVKYNFIDSNENITALIFGEIYRHNGDWKFKAIGQGFMEGMPGLEKLYGVGQ